MNPEIIDFLPTFNAICNATATLLILAGLGAVHAKKITLHKGLMTLAFLTSMLFLCGYLTRHYFAGSTPFQGQGGWRLVYFGILITHIILAIVNLPLVLITMFFGVTNRIAKHKRIAKITAPIWLYVSATGVVVYFMLYCWFA